MSNQLQQNSNLQFGLSQSEFITQSITCASARSQADLMNSNPYDLLRKLDIPKRAHASLVSLVKELGPLKATELLALSKFWGIKWQDVPTFYHNNPQLNFINYVYSEEEFPILEIPEDQAILDISRVNLELQSINLIPGSFFPISEERLRGKNSSLSQGRTLIFYPSDRIINEIIESLGRLVSNNFSKDIFELNVPGAIARIDIFVITAPLMRLFINAGAELGQLRDVLDITNRNISELPRSSILEFLEMEDALPPSLQDWRVQMVLAAETALNSFQHEMPWKLAIWPDRNKDEYNKATSANAFSYSKRFQKQMQQLGYNLKVLEDGKLDANKDFSVTSERESYFQLLNSSFFKKENPDLYVFEEVYNKLANFWEYSVAEGEQIPLSLSIPKSFIVDGDNLENAIRDSLERAPQRYKALDMLEGMTSSMHECWRRQINQAPWSKIVSALQPEFTFISRGKAGGVDDQWWQNAAESDLVWSAKAYHIKGQDRHPSLRFIHQSSTGAEQYCLGIKGGGLREVISKDIWAQENIDKDGYRHPIYSSRMPLEDEPEIPSHRFWGGILTADAEEEFVNTLALHRLIDITNIKDIEIPIALDTGTLTDFPVWKDGVTEWRDALQYYGTATTEWEPDPKKRLGVYRSLYRSDVRISQLFNQLFSEDRDVRQDLRSTIVDCMKHLYFVNGYKFTDPGYALHPINGMLGAQEILWFLRRCYLANRESADQILNKMNSNSLKLTALVHGAGGHLGASKTKVSLGGFSGGALAIRNVDLRGVPHDFDRDVYLPWIERIEYSPTYRATQRHYLKNGHYFDLLHWRHTTYWTEKILRGIPLNKSAVFYNHSVGEYERFVTLQAKPAAIYNVKNAIRKVDKDSKIPLLERFNLGQYEDLYNSYCKIGNEIAAQLIA